MRAEAAGGAARRPQKPRRQAAAPACRGTCRSPKSARADTEEPRQRRSAFAHSYPRPSGSSPALRRRTRLQGDAGGGSRPPAAYMGAHGAACAGVDAALRVRTTRPAWQVQPECPSSTSLGSGILIHCWNLLSRQSRIDSVSPLTALGNLAQGHWWLLNLPCASMWVDVLCESG